MVYTEPDRLQHLVWDESTLREHYEQLDAMLGDAIDHVAATDGTLYVVSDHGFGPVDRTAHLNTILRDHGFLQPADGGIRGLLSRIGVTKDRTLTGLNRLGISEKDIVRHLPDEIVDSAAATIPGNHGLFDVNHATTQAFAHGMGNIYVNTTDRFASGTVAPADRDDVKRKIRAVFEGATDPETGESPLTVVDGDDEFPTDPDAPDLVVQANGRYTLDGSLASDPFDATSKAGDHKPEGIFLAWGEDIATGVTPTDVTVYDFAPTVLHGLGKPVPHDTDGRVLTEIFQPDSPPAETDVERHDYETDDRATADDDTTEDDFTEVENRLKGLGYME